MPQQLGLLAEGTSIPILFISDKSVLDPKLHENKESITLVFQLLEQRKSPENSILQIEGCGSWEHHKISSGDHDKFFSRLQIVRVTINVMKLLS